MQLSLASVKAEIPCRFAPASGEEYCHVLRGVGIKEFRRLMDDFDRSGVTGEDETGEAAEDFAVAIDRDRARWFSLWEPLVRRVEGYPDADELEGAALVAYFRGEASGFEALDEETRTVFIDVLARHVKAACEHWLAANVARYSFRSQGEGGSVGASA